MAAALRRPFSSLAVPNYRRFFCGQVISVTGNWMQNVAEMWLVLRLTGSGLAVGLVTAFQFLPFLLGGAWGGVLADRLDKRRMLMVTQGLMALPALALFALATAGSVQAWMVYALVLVRGTVNAIDNPARQSLVFEIVGRDRVVNAVSLNSVLVHSSRIAGPAAAGVVIAVAGVAPCFALNALSFGAMWIALWRMDRRELTPSEPTGRERGQIRSALSYVRATPSLWIPLAAMGLVGMLSFNFQVLLPLLARFTWHGGASTYALLTSTMAVGSVLGALAAGARGRVDGRLLSGAAAAFGTLTLVAAAAPTLPLQLLALPLLGAASVTFAAGVNSALQLAVTPEMRGRVMSLYAVVFLGSTPLGGPLVGWLAGAAGPRAGLVLGGVAALVAAGASHVAFGRAAARRESAVGAERHADDERVRRGGGGAATRSRREAPGHPRSPRSSRTA